MPEEQGSKYVGQYGGPYTGQYGRVRLSPLVETVAARNEATGGTSATPGAGGRRGAGAGGDGLASAPTAPDPKDVAQAQADAQRGDSTAADWLRMLGAGAAGGALVGGPLLGYALYRALKQRTGVGLDAAAEAGAPASPDLLVDRPGYDPRTGVLSEDPQLGGPSAPLRIGSSSAINVPPDGFTPKQGAISARTQPTSNLPGKTQRQTETDLAYGQREAQNAANAPKTETMRVMAVRAAKREALQRAARAAERAIRR